MNSTHQTIAEYQKSHIAHWDKVARETDAWHGWGKSYHRRVSELYRFLAGPNQRILEIGCGRGDLLASLRPADGVGIDFSQEIFSEPVSVTPRLMRSNGSKRMLAIYRLCAGRLM